FGTHAIFHNAVSGGTFANGNPSDLVIGSNWYGAGVPAPAAPAGVLIAGAMTVQPIGHPLCGDNTPDQVEVYAGSGQSAPVDSAFAQPLQARVVDALGGAVPGVVVDFSAPGTGAGAALAPPLAVTDHNGVAATAATANGLAGSYEVTAAAGTLVAVPGFSLTNTMGTAMVTVHDASYTYDGQQIGRAHV